MSVRNAGSTTTVKDTTAADRMRALLAHTGPMVHVSHTHRVSSTGVEWVRALDGTTQRVYAKGDEVEYTKSDGSIHLATVVGVSPATQGTVGMPSGYEIKVRGQDNVVDTVAKRLRPHNPNSFLVKGHTQRLVVTYDC